MFLLFVFILAFIIYSGPEAFIKVFYPQCINYVDAQQIDSIFIARTERVNTIARLILDEQLVSPCLLQDFLALDESLHHKMSSCITEGSFLIEKKGV